MKIVCESNTDDMQRGDLLKQYLMKMNPTTYTTKKNINYIEKCKFCNIEMTLIQSEGIYVCKNCGNTTNAIIVLVSS